MKYIKIDDLLNQKFWKDKITFTYIGRISNKNKLIIRLLLNLLMDMNYLKKLLNITFMLLVR